MSKNIQHIAVIRLSAMGDVAMTVPVLRALLTQNPELKITMVSRPFFKPFFDDIPNLTFFAVDVNNRHKGMFGLYRLFQDLKQLNIDAFADLHNVLRSRIVGLLFKLSGTKTAIVDKARAEKKALVRSENKIFKQLKPIVQRHVEVFQELGFNVDLNAVDFAERPKIPNSVNEIIGEGDHKLIGIAPFAQYESKVYPIDLMQEVVRLLANNSNYKIILFGGGAKEKAMLEDLSIGFENVYNLAGKIPFKEELQLISNLDVMLSMDSGNAHIAAMYGVKVITIWGATHPFAGFMPFNQPMDFALTANRNLYPLLPTSIYGNKIVPGYEEVMRSILPEEIAYKIKSIL